jgi:uncharacterized protein (DUF433 family)
MPSRSRPGRLQARAVQPMKSNRATSPDLPIMNERYGSSVVHASQNHERSTPVPRTGLRRPCLDEMIVPMNGDLLERIAINPAVAGGKATIRGHRIWVSLILGLLADGMNVPEILAEHRGIDEADVRACLAYGARLAGGRFVDLGPPKA